MEVKKKEFTFRGKNIEELKKLNVREFSAFVTSRQRRSILHQFNDIENFITRAKKKMRNNKPIRTHKRDLVVVPEMVGMKISVYDGRSFVPVEITGEKLGHLLGEFAPSRKKISHGSAGVGATKGSKFKSKK